jgi:hypothetical protein
MYSDKPRGRAGGTVGITTGGGTMIGLKATKARKTTKETLKEELLMRLTKDGQFHETMILF